MNECPPLQYRFALVTGRKRLLRFAALLSCAASLFCALPTSAQETFKGVGTVTAGPCAQADVFIDSLGNRYEIDKSRTTLAKAVPLTLLGHVYRHISVCKVYPWLDVQSNRVGPATSDEETADHVEVNSLTITVEASDFVEVTQWLPTLASRNNVSKIYLRVPEGVAASRIPDFLLSFGADGLDVMSKVEFKIGPAAQPIYQWRGPNKIIAFRSLKDVKYALSLN